MQKIKSIRTAKKLFNQGFLIRVVPNKINPNNIWGLYADIKKLDCNSIQEMDDIRYCNDFNFIINNFKYYNCNNETGLYCSFYLLENTLK